MNSILVCTHARTHARTSPQAFSPWRAAAPSRGLCLVPSPGGKPHPPPSGNAPVGGAGLGTHVAGDSRAHPRSPRDSIMVTHGERRVRVLLRADLPPRMTCPVPSAPLRSGCRSFALRAAFPSRAPERLELPRPGLRHVIRQEVFLAFSLTKCFQISLLLTSKENESVFFFFFLPRVSLSCRISRFP